MKEFNSDNRIPKRLIDAVNYLKSNKDIIITKADKGGKAVVLDKRVYLQKMNELLDDDTYQKLNSNPLQKWQRSYNSKLKSILKQYPDFEKRFRSYMPSLPSMYGLPKIHKVNNPMRPIISTINSVNYKLARWLSDHLSPLLNKIAGIHLTNTLDFVKKKLRI